MPGMTVSGGITGGFNPGLMSGVKTPQTDPLHPELWGRTPAPTAPVQQFGAPSNFTAAANTQASDYDKIMQAYQAAQKANSPINYTPVTPQLTQYSGPSASTMSAISNLNDLASNGGYSGQSIADLRARGVSPIRSVYASAQRNIDRQRTLQGGYSPNYTAATAKLTRDEAQQIGDANQNVNAGIAQNQASNRIGVAGTAASVSAELDRQKQQIEQENAAAVNRANELNAQLPLQYRQSNVQTSLAPIEGMKSLYGTTPALTSLFGNQVQSAEEIAAQKRAQDIGASEFGYSTASQLFR